MRTRSVGNNTVGRIEVGAIGLGLMTFDHTETQPRQQLLDTVRAALEAGVTLFDSADAYGPGDELGAAAQGANETLIAGLLDELGLRNHVLLATKVGHVRTEGGGWALDGSPTHLRRAVTDSLRRLKVEQITLWQYHRPDPNVPYLETLGALKEIYDSGLVAMIGVCNANREQIAQAHAVLGDALVSVQNQFSPAFRSSQREIELCAELALAFFPWSPLGGPGDAKRLALNYPAFNRIAVEAGVSPQQVALAWELAQAPIVIPIPGAKRPESITDSAAAADLQLTTDQLETLNRS